MVLILADGILALKEQYIDGTKTESCDGKYTFVRKKSAEKNRAKPKSKICCILHQVKEVIATDHTPDDELPTPDKSEELCRCIVQINRENKSKQQQKQTAKMENKYLPKMEDYE